jgi:hypothetical protein
MKLKSKHFKRKFEQWKEYTVKIRKDYYNRIVIKSHKKEIKH